MLPDPVDYPAHLGNVNCARYVSPGRPAGLVLEVRLAQRCRYGSAMSNPPASIVLAWCAGGEDRRVPNETTWKMLGQY